MGFLAETALSWNPLGHREYRNKKHVCVIDRNKFRNRHSDGPCLVGDSLAADSKSFVINLASRIGGGKAL